MFQSQDDLNLYLKFSYELQKIINEFSIFPPLKCRHFPAGMFSCALFLKDRCHFKPKRQKKRKDVTLVGLRREKGPPKKTERKTLS